MTERLFTSGDQKPSDQGPLIHLNAGGRLDEGIEVARRGFDVKAISKTLLFFSLLIPLSSAESADWFLVGKEGECAPLSILEKKGPEFRGLESPYQLAEKMRAAGYKAEIKEHKAASRPSVEIRVPERQLYLMFMKANVCRKNAPPKP